MLILGIDTATMTLSLSLVRREQDGADEVLSEAFYPPPAQHSALLPGEIGRLLEGTGRSLDDLTAIVVGLGPGSFTGLRVGLATARAVSFARNIPLIGASSLHALALTALRQAPDALLPGELLVPLFDARKGEVYGGLFRVTEGGALSVEEAEFVVKPEVLLQKLSGEAHLRLFGPGRAAYPALHALPRLSEDVDPTPSAAALIASVKEIPMGLSREALVAAAGALEPHYVRPSDHEWKMAHPTG